MASHALGPFGVAAEQSRRSVASLKQEGKNGIVVLAIFLEVVILCVFLLSFVLF